MGRGVLELQGPIELVVYWGGGRTHAAWLCSQTGRVLLWSVVGVA